MNNEADEEMEGAYEHTWLSRTMQLTKEMAILRAKTKKSPKLNSFEPFP